MILLIIDNWLNWLKTEKHCSNNTISAYQNDIKNFVEFLSQYNNCDINIDILRNLQLRDLRSWLAYRVKNYNKAISNARALSAVKNFFKYINRNHNIKNDAIFYISKPRVNKNLPKVLLESQIHDIIQEVSKYASTKHLWVKKRDIAVCLLLYGSGLRISEALNIRFQDIDNDEITVVGKGKKERKVFLLPLIKKQLDDYIVSCPYFKICNKDQYIFVGLRGKKLHRTYFANIIQNISNQLNIVLDGVKFTPHTFRHSFATHLFNNGADIRSIQELLGHSNLSTTQIYTHLDHQNIINTYKNFHPQSLESEECGDSGDKEV